MGKTYRKNKFGEACQDKDKNYPKTKCQCSWCRNVNTNQKKRKIKSKFKDDIKEGIEAYDERYDEKEEDFIDWF